MTRFTRMLPDNIIVGERYRVDYGDIETLAEDITARGLLQPIVVNESKELCAGGRRLQAFRFAQQIFTDKNGDDAELPSNISKIPVHVVEAADELDLREIELVENVLRKDMSWAETVKLQKCIHDMMIEKYPDDWTMRQTAKMLTKSAGALSDNLQLAEVITAFPDLEKEPTADGARKKFKRALERAEVTADLSKAKRQVALQENMNAEAAEAGETAEKIVSNTDHWMTVLDNAYTIGDAIDGMWAARAGAAHFAEVDPPYGVDLQNEKSAASAGIASYNEVPKDEYEDFLKRTCEALYYALADDAFVVWWHGPTWNRETLLALQEAGFKVDDIPCIWNKTDTGAAANNPDVYLGRAYEPFYLARKGTPVLRKRGRKNVFDAKPIPAQQKFHPTERPIGLIREVISTLLYPGARVLVPFLGSGNSIIAAYQEGAKLVWGFDLSEVYRDGFFVKAKAELMKKTQREYEHEAMERVAEET